MTRWRVFLGTALAVLLASTGIAQTLPTPQADPQPTFRVQVWGFIVADFSTRVQSYFDLRSPRSRQKERRALITGLRRRI